VTATIDRAATLAGVRSRLKGRPIVFSKSRRSFAGRAMGTNLPGVAEGIPSGSPARELAR